MKSSGGLASASAFHGRDAILSGPAGGIVGMVGSAAPLSKTRLIGFDMGGTSTDVSHYAGRFERDNETIVAGTRIRAPMLRIHTVAAGGGSICRWDGARLLVRSEEHTSELQSLMRISYAVFCLTKQKYNNEINN